MTGFPGRGIELWVEARHGAAAVNSTMHAVLAALRAGGTQVRVRVPEMSVLDPDDRAPAPDLVLLKTATTFGMSVALADEAAGGRFLNRAWLSVRSHDKAATIARLADAGLPVPPTFLAQHGQRPVEAVDDADGAWFVKPARGVHGTGVARHDSFPHELDEAAPATGALVVDDGTRLVQAAAGGDEPDLKVYVAGEAIFAGRKRFSTTSYEADDVEPVALGDSEIELVRAAGEALGLRLFGLDLRGAEDGSVIVDANPFPGYRGFQAAVRPILDEIAKAMAE